MRKQTLEVSQDGFKKLNQRFEELYSRSTKYLSDFDIWKSTVAQCLDAYKSDSKNPKNGLDLISKNTHGELFGTGEMFKTQFHSTLTTLEPLVRRTVKEVKTDKSEFPNIINIFDITFPRFDMESMIWNTPVHNSDFDKMIDDIDISLPPKSESPLRNPYPVTSTPMTHPIKYANDLIMNQPVKPFTTNNIETIKPIQQPLMDKFPITYTFGPAQPGAIGMNSPSFPVHNDIPMRVDPVFRKSMDSNQMNQIGSDYKSFMKKTTGQYNDNSSTSNPRPFQNPMNQNHLIDNTTNISFGIPINRQTTPNLHPIKDLSEPDYSSNQNIRRPSANVMDSTMFKNDENLLVEVSIGDIPGLMTDQSINFEHHSQLQPAVYQNLQTQLLMNEVFNTRPLDQYPPVNQQVGPMHRFSQPSHFPSANFPPTDNFREADRPSIRSLNNASFQSNPQKGNDRYSNTLGNGQIVKLVSKSKSKDKESAMQNKLGKMVDIRHATPQTTQKTQGNTFTVQFMQVLQNIKTQKLVLIDLSESGNVIRTHRLAH